MSFEVAFSPRARIDLHRLHDYLLDRAEYLEDLELADRAIEAVVAAVDSLAATPFLFRKAGGSHGPLRRELVVPSGSTGYVVAYEIAKPGLVIILAVRHQREEDNH